MWGWAVAALAEPYRAGHHHPEHDWATLETRWFRVHYASGGGDHPVDASRTAHRVAAVADELLLRLANHVGQVPHGPIHVVVSDEADAMSAYTLPGWSWIVLSADPGVDVGRLRGRRDWVEATLTHELGHLVAHRESSPWAPTATYGIEAAGAGSSGPVGVGAAVVLGSTVPFGWSEGAAEAWSHAIGVDTWSANRRALLRTSALSDRLLSWDEWLVSVDKDDALDSERAYQQGNAFARWLAEEHAEADGEDDVFARMAELARERYRGSWGPLLRQVTGEPPRVTWDRWGAAAVADAVAERARLSARGLVEGELVERFAPAYTSDDLDRRDTWAVQSPRAREQDRERTGTFELYPQTSPDGRWYAEGKVGWVHVERGDPAEWPVGSYGAVRAREDRTSATSVWVPGAFGNRSAFVPGEDALIVAAPEDVRRRWFAPTPRDPWLVLYRVDLTPDTRSVRHRGGELGVERLRMRPRDRRRRMTPIPGTSRARDPAVSPDGTRLAWLAYADGATELVVAGVDGSDPRRLPFGEVRLLQHPSWSPDGERIVASVLDGERPDLWVVEVATGRWSPLTTDPHDEVDPSWAADGIWFCSDRDGVFDVYRLEPGSGAATRMTRTLGGAMTPFVDRHGDLLYAAITADGYKVARIPRDALAFDPVPPFGGSAGEDPTGDPTAPDPGPTGPTPTDPAPTDPTSLDPAPMDRGPTEPTSLDPGPTEATSPDPRTPDPAPASLHPAVNRVEPVDLGGDLLEGSESAARRYRWWRNPLTPGVAPLLRLDFERAGPSLTAGAFVRARDAVEQVQLTLQGLAGSDFLGDAELVWRGWWPEVHLFASGAADRRLLADGLDDQRAWGVLGARLVGRYRDHVSGTVSGSAWSTWRDQIAQVRSVRASVGLTAGEPPDRDAPRGARADLVLTRAWSEQLATGAVGAWHRVELDASGEVPLPLSVGPLDEQQLRLEWSALGGVTDRVVHPDEALYAGGDVPGALRPDAPMMSSPFPGFDAYAIRGSTLGVGYARVVVPVAVRLRTSCGPLYLQGVDLAAGGGVAGVPAAGAARSGWARSASSGSASSRFASAGSAASAEAPVLGSAGVELRTRTLLLDTPWDSVARVAWGIGQPSAAGPSGPGTAATGFGAGQIPGPSSGPRLYLGLGTGF